MCKHELTKSKLKITYRPKTPCRKSHFLCATVPRKANQILDAKWCNYRGQTWYYLTFTSRFSELYFNKVFNSIYLEAGTSLQVSIHGRLIALGSSLWFGRYSFDTGSSPSVISYFVVGKKLNRFRRCLSERQKPCGYFSLVLTGLVGQFSPEFSSTRTRRFQH